MRIELNPQGQEPIYRQIHQRIRVLIESGQLRADQRLPSIRALAQELGLARGTVEVAYDLLAAEGYIVGKGAAGTFVSGQLPPLRQPASPRGGPSLSADPNAAATALPLQMGLPALDAFPLALWQRLLAKRVRACTQADLAYPPVGGTAPLKAALANYVQLARGIACQPEQIMVVAGYQAAIGLLTEVLAVNGQSVWLEDPGYLFGRKAWRQAGAHIVAVPVDAEGLCVTAGMDLAPQACCAVVTPAHQSPLTVSLSMPRRKALLAWAQRAQAWIIEDDYDGEYRYRGWPLPALSSMMGAERCIAVGSLSKVLYPGLRLAYVVLPSALVVPALAALNQSVYQAPLLGQQALADFMTAGHFSRHIKKMRRLYAQRRQTVVEVFQQRLARWLTLTPEAGGMHLVAQVNTPYVDAVLAQRGQAQGLAIQALSAWAVAAENAQQGLLFGFANVVDAQQAQAYADTLARAWQDL